MDYSKTTIQEIYSSVYNYGQPEESYLEAENIFEFRKLIIKWFNMIENGTANKIYPDFFDNSVTLEKANLLIEEIEDDFLKESGRWEYLNVNAGPGFTRLNPPAKIAFAQQIFKLIKSPEQITKEVEEKKRNNEKIIPDNLVQPYYYGCEME